MASRTYQSLVGLPNAWDMEDSRLLTYGRVCTYGLVGNEGVEYRDNRYWGLQGMLEGSIPPCPMNPPIMELQHGALSSRQLAGNPRQVTTP